MQGRFDYYHEIVSVEYGKLKDFKLINEYNQASLQAYKDQRLYEIYNAGSTWDLSITANAQKLISYCTEIYSDPFIKSEILLLQSCKTEIDRIKYKDPDNYIYSKRYKSILKTLDLLKSCKPSEISNLSWEKTELQESFQIENLDNSVFTFQCNKKEITIASIYKSVDYTVVQLIYTLPSIHNGSCAGCYINFSPNAFIAQNDKKYFLIKAENIPMSPNKFYFDSTNSLNFKLYFDKTIDLNSVFNLIEVEGSSSAFNFYNISK
jgi:hypothetical protein